MDKDGSADTVLIVIAKVRVIPVGPVVGVGAEVVGKIATGQDGPLRTQGFHSCQRYSQPRLESRELTWETPGTPSYSGVPR